MSWKIICGLSLLSTVFAQQPIYAQCGGINWTGGTTCISGTICTEQNAYYSQCLPSTATPTPTEIPTTVPLSTTKPTSTSPAIAPNFWFSFGDSYTQTGFEDNETLPAIGNPLGNPPYPGYTAVGGTNWIDVDTVVYNKSLVLTYNYAYGGATIDSSLVAPYEPTVLSMTDQVNEFLNTVASKPSTTPWTSGNALFSFWIGINDIGNSYYESGSRTTFDTTLINAYFALVQKFNVGARNFLFLNVPPVDRSPLMLAESTSAQALEKSVIADFNSQLAAAINSFKSNNTGVQTYLWDANAAFTTVLNSPTTYGFVDATSYGGTNDFWGNNLHPSSAAQTLWGQGVAAVLANTVW